MKEQIDALRRAEQGIDTAANIQTRPELKPEIIDMLPDEKSQKPAKVEKNVKPEKNEGSESPKGTVPAKEPALPVEPVVTPEPGGE